MTVGDLQFKFSARGADDVERASSKAKSSLQSVERAQEDVAQTSTTMSTSVSSSANNLGFEFVQAAQDARFGAAGVANQIPLMTEQFQQLRSKTGSATGALKALGSTFLGPAGIIGAVTLLLPHMGDLIDFFTGAANQAELAADKIKEARQAVVSFESGVQERQFSAQNIDRAVQRLENRTSALRRLISNLDGEIPILDGTPILPEVGTDLSQVQREIVESIAEQNDAQNVSISLLEQRLKREQDLLKTARKNVKAFEEQQLQAEIADQVGANIKDAAENSVDLQSALTRVRQELESASEQEFDLKTGDFDTRSIENLSDELEPSRALFVDPEQAAAVARLRAKLEQLPPVFTRIRAAIVRTSRQFSENLRRRAVQGLAQINRALGQSIGRLIAFPNEINSAADAFKVLKRTAQRVLQQVIAQVVSAIIKLTILQSIFSAFTGGIGSVVPTGAAIGGGAPGIAAATAGTSAITQTASARVGGGFLKIPTEQITNATGDGRSNQTRLARE